MDSDLPYQVHQLQRPPNAPEPINVLGTLALGDSLRPQTLCPHPLSSVRPGLDTPWILRRQVKADIALSKATTEQGGAAQIELVYPERDVRAWEYAVLVTHSSYELAAFGQLY